MLTAKSPYNSAHLCTSANCVGGRCINGKCECNSKDVCDSSSPYYENLQFAMSTIRVNNQAGGKICASDGEFYNNICELAMESCKTGKTIEPRPKSDCYIPGGKAQEGEENEEGLKPVSKISRECNNLTDFVKCAFGAVCKLFGDGEQATAFCDCSVIENCGNEKRLIFQFEKSF